MTYASVESSLDAGTPVELYQFRQGVTKAWNFASCADDLVVTPTTYIATQIVRNRIQQTQDINRDGIRLTFPRGDAFAQQFVSAAPDEVTTVTILRGHIGDGEFITYWKGRVVGATASDNSIDVECESVFTSLTRSGLRAKFELTCRHLLYSPQCGVNASAFKITRNVVSITGLNVSIGGTWTAPDGYYSGGEIVDADGTRRFITAQVSNVVTMNRPLPGLAGGATVDLYPGCDHLKETCRDKFSNMANYGGFPFIPGVNPFGGQSII